MEIRPLLKAALLGWRRPATLALALVTAACVAGACTTARADLAARTHALTELLADSPPSLETITASLQYGSFMDYVGSLNAAALEQTTSTVYSALEPEFSLSPRSQAWGSIVNNGHALPGAPPSLQPLGWDSPVVSLGYFEGLEQHARLTAGRWPSRLTDSPSTGITADVVVTQDTMKLLRVKLGSELDDGYAPAWNGDLKLVVVGVIAPVQPSGAYWAATGVLQTPIKHIHALGSTPNWDLGAFIGPDEVVSGILGDWDATVTWNVPLAAEMTADQGASLQRDLNSRLTGASLALDRQTQQGLGLQFDSGLGPLLLAFVDAQSAAELQTAMPEAGLGAIALLAMLLLLRWTIEARRTQTETLRARGAALWWLSLTAAGESALVIVPVGAVGWAAGVAPRGPLPGGPAGISALSILVLPIAVGLWTFLRHRPIGRRDPRRHSPAPRTAGYRIARRVVLFATAAALCLLSLQQAHAHGLSPATGIDPLSALSPIAAAGLATVLAAAIAPQLIRVLLRPVRSRRGIVALLGLTRMARVPGPALVILLVLSLALCTADLAFALERTPVGGSGAPAGSSAADAAQAGWLMHQSIAVMMEVLAGLAVATACLVVALVALGDAAERRAAAARLSVMGLTGSQQRNLTLAELSAPLGLACLCASLAAGPLLWVVRPALTRGFTGDPRMTWFCLGLPVLIVVPAALATGLAGAGLARRGPAGSLRGGDYAEGI
jgi:putative ABC transport system permease protein